MTQGDPWVTTWQLVQGLAPALIPLLGRHRLTREEITDSPVRKRILDAVRKNPGISTSQLRSRVGLGWGALYHHLEKLEEEDLLHTRTVGPRRLAFIPEAAEESQAQAIAMLRHPTARKIAMAIAAKPGTTVQDLVAATGESPRVVYYHVRHLSRAGLVKSGSRTRHVDLKPTSALLLILAEASRRDGR